MKSLARSLRSTSGFLPLALDQWIEMFKYGGNPYSVLANQSLVQQVQEVPDSFSGYVESTYRSNGVIYACIAARMMLFSEARFAFRRMEEGRPGDLYSDSSLDVLRTPWVNGTTGDLLSRMEIDASLAGNAFVERLPPTVPGGLPTLSRLRPDWVTIVLGSRLDPDTPNWQRDRTVLGYMYQPGGRGGGQKPQFIAAENMAHYAPIPDPNANYRGMSWLTPILTETMADTASTQHKLQFFRNGATPNVVVSLPNDVTPTDFPKWIELFESEYGGIENAYRTLFFGGGADVKVIGADLQQIDFKQTQGHGETRICAAARVPPIVVGVSEGLDSATYSNYASARRSFVDGTMRVLWRQAAAALTTLIDMPGPNVELWYDDRDIPYLQEDVKDEADIQQILATSIRTLVDAGFEPDAVTDAVIAGDLGRLKGKHSGLFSVQLQPPNTVTLNPGVTGPSSIDPAEGDDTSPVSATSNGTGQ